MHGGHMGQWGTLGLAHIWHESKLLLVIGMVWVRDIGLGSGLCLGLVVMELMGWGTATGAVGLVGVIFRHNVTIS